MSVFQHPQPSHRRQACQSGHLHETGRRLLGMAVIQATDVGQVVGDMDRLVLVDGNRPIATARVGP